MKQHIIDFLENLLFIFMPSYWVMIQPYDRDWDNKMKQLLCDNTHIEILSQCRALIGTKEVWIANWPYGALNPAKPEINVRPSRLTIKRYGNRIKRLKKSQKKRELLEFIN